jgi:predicted AAA+ superfamily ATPase
VALPRFTFHISRLVPTAMTDRLNAFLERAERLLDRLEHVLPSSPTPTDWHAHAFRWRRGSRGGWLEAIAHPHQIALSDLCGIERQKEALVRNTAQFMAALPANNALLWGARGTGKSSLIKGLLNRFAGEGLRLIEVEKQELIDLPEIVTHLRPRPERFVLFCDDLSFDADEPGYKALKVVLDGSLSAPPENVLIYASSNRRHILPEYREENREAQIVDGELHPGEAVEEKIALSDRFGLWLSFYPFSQEAYLEVVFHWLERLGAAAKPSEAIRQEAIRWALARGGRSGRAAWQFARDWVGRAGLERGAATQ